MPTWIPSKDYWAGQDAVLIGGGASLAKFDFSKLEGRNTIGCNDAFRLGPGIVKIALFGDKSWFDRNSHALEKFPGIAATVAPTMENSRIPWLKTLARSRIGLHHDSVGWNFSTGAAAVGLALNLGAKRVFLLGYDMSSQPGTKKTHWHNHAWRPVPDYSYRRFINGFANVYRDLVKYPGVRVYNVTNGESKLPLFPRMTFDVFLRFVPLKDRDTCVECEERKQLAKEMATA